jgi:AcrR family transcriptional regulator
VAAAGRQSARRAAVEREVLRAAAELLAEGASFAELNVERIATRAGISRTAFYFYFRDKRELLLRLAGEVGDELVRAADRWRAADETPRAALERIARIQREHGALLRAVVEAAASDAEVAAFWRALVGRFVDATQERIAAEQRAGRALPGPPAALAFALTWAVERSLHEHAAQDGPVDLDELVEALATMFTRTLYGRP